MTASLGARFTVIVVNYNGGDMLLDCIRSIRAQHVPEQQVIVVDNGSHDTSIEQLKQSVNDLVIIRNNCNAGFARAVNQGIARCTETAEADFVLLLNNDAQLLPGALQAFAHGFDTLPRMAIAGGQLIYPDGRLQSAFAPFPSIAEEILPRPLLRHFSPKRFGRKTLENSPMPVDCVLGACLCVRASSLAQLGLLDEEYFFFFEEIEWCHRAWQLGAEVYHLPAARAMHRQGQTADRFRGPARVEYQRSKLTFFRKTRSRTAYLLVSFVLVLRTLINAISGTVACVATLFLKKHLRKKTAVYWYLLNWHLQFRPASWGLPGKCTGRPDPMKRSSNANPQRDPPASLP